MGAENKTAENRAADHARRKREMRTQGVKGCKAPRITMAFSTDNYDYIQYMARLKGLTLVKFVNQVLDEHRTANADLYRAAMALVGQVDAQQAGEEDTGAAQEAAGEEGSE